MDANNKTELITVSASEDSLAEVKGVTIRAVAWRQFRRNRGAVVGLIIALALLVMALAAPVIAPYDPNAATLDTLSSPNLHHLLGTDVYGRDILSRVIWGSRISLTVGILSVAIGTVLGCVLGLLAGYHGGKVDAIIVMAMDTMLAFPGILLALSIVAVLGANIRNVMIAVGISSVPTYTRLVRSAVLSARQNTYVESARVVGCGGTRIMFRHILPNVTAPIIVLSTISIAFAILTAAGLSFLGLGAQPPSPEWGAMVSDGREYLRVAWWVSTGPGVAIMITVLAINILGDGLRDALDPRLRL